MIRLWLREWLGIEADRKQHQIDHARWHEEGNRERQKALNEQASRYAEQQRMSTDQLLARWEEMLKEHSRSNALDEFWRAALGSGKSASEALEIAKECMERKRLEAV